MKLSRRTMMLGTTAAAAAFAVGCGKYTNGTNPDKKLNILYVMSDDHAAHAVGAYGKRLAGVNPTPNLDKLVAGGTRYNNVFTTNSICTPSRATILTGQYSQTNGVLDLGGTLPSEKQSLVNAIKTAGYNTAIIGKWHLKKEPASFDHYEVLDGQGTYFDPKFFVRGDKPWKKNINKTVGHSTDVITDKGLEWLKDVDHEKPFMLMLQYKAPHDMFEYAPRYEDYLADTFIPEPVDLYERGDEFGSIATRGENNSLDPISGTSVSKRNKRRNMGIHLEVDPSLSDKEYTSLAYQRYMKAYLRCIKGIDDNLGRVFDQLKADGLWENTVVIYTSDQGFMLGEHDMIDKRWMYEPSMQMPFLVRHPKLSTPKTSDLLINNTDFAPFILDLAGVGIPADMHGRSFASSLKGETPADWRTATYYRYWMHRAHHDVPAHFGVRTKKHKLIFFYGKFYQDNVPDQSAQHHYPGDTRTKMKVKPASVETPAAWELYDLEKDPDELVNVYGNPKYANVIAELKEELIRQRKEYNETDASYPELQAIIDAHWND